MSLTVSASAGGNYSPIPAGTYTAVCNMLVDLGMQETEYNGKIKKQRKVRIGWQIPEETIVNADGEEVPRTIGKTYTASLDERASLRSDLEAWRGRQFTPEELAGFELTNIVGKCCLIQINHSTKGDKTYANIQSIMSLPKSMPKALLFGDALVFDLDADPLDRIGTMPDWLKEIIEKSETYKERLANNVAPVEFTELDDGDGQLPF